MHRALWIQYGCLSAAVAVATGAYGAHGLKTRVADEKLLKTWETAAYYHLIHSIGLIGVGLTPRHSPTAGYCFLCGIGLFCGSLYALALTGNRKLGAITPIGGIGFILGWIILGLRGV